MIDTIKLDSPAVSNEVLNSVQSLGTHKVAYEGETGLEVYHLMTGELLGSHDHRIAFRVFETDSPDGNEHRIRVEGSVHKNILGYNFSGGSDDLLASGRWLIERLASRLETLLPDADGWSLKQTDVANCYDLGFEQAEGYIRTFGGVAYPRRKVARYGDESIHVPGAQTTIKLYRKGLEFSKNDFARISRSMGVNEAARLQQLANPLLRSEVSIRRRLRNDEGKYPRLDEVDYEDLQAIHDAEISKLLREGKSAMETVRTYQAVKARLQEVYTVGQAGTLMGTWTQLSAMGELEMRNSQSRRTFYRHRKMLVDAGVSWHSSDIIQQAETAFPIDFKPLSTDARCLRGEHPLMSLALDPFRRAA